MKALVSLPAFAVVLFLDVISKAVAVAVLSPAGIPRPVVGEWVRLALVYRQLDKMGPAENEALQAQAQANLARIDSL